MGAVVADFNGDGRLDLASVGFSNMVSVVLQQSNAVFEAPVDYSTGSSPFTLIATSLRNNGKIDLVTVNMPNGIDQPGSVSVLLANGDGTFQTHVDYSVGNFPVGIVAGDFNSDGKTDLAIANDNDSTVSILYGNGDGTFQPQVLVNIGLNPTSIATGDFNADNKTDLIASCVGSGVVTVLLNDGGGSYTRVDSSTNLIFNDKSLVVTGKFNNSGKLDAVFSSQMYGDLYLLEGNGDGSFKPPASLSSSGVGEVYSLVATDVNRDSKIDLAYGSVAPSAFSVLLGNGRGQFAAPVSSSVFATESIALADINGDGFLDLITPQQSLSSIAVVLGNGKGTFGLPNTINLKGTLYGPNSTVVADFNGDGNLDIAVAEENFPTGQIAVSLGAGHAQFGAPVISPLLSEALNNGDLMLAGDFNGDGRTDLIVMDDYSTGFQVLLGNGDGTFKTAVDTKLNTTLNFAVGDFNDDGKTDVVVSTFSNGLELISIYLSNGDGTFTPGAKYTEQLGGPVVADVNGDGKQDLVFVGNPFFVMLGNGDGTFQNAIAGPAITPGSTQAVLKDFNGDGFLDVVVGTYQGLAFLKGNGNGTFQNPIYSNSTIGFCCQIFAEDVNGDGKLDLVNNGSGTVLVMAGNGDGTFQSPTSYGVNGQIYSGNIVGGDFNADGIGDVGVVYQNLASATTDLSLYLSSPTAVLFPTAINFGSISVGQTSATVDVIFSNAGNEKLSVSSIQVSGNFTQQNDCGRQLKIGQTCTIQVSFQPKVKGVQSGTVTIKDNALGSPQRISLTGTGK